MTVGLTRAPLDPDAALAAVAHPSCGAVMLFLGTTRDTFDGHRVERLEYEAWEPVALRQLQDIADHVARRWPGSRACLFHRLGLVPVGATSVIIAVASPHRDAAYEASRYAIEALKAEVSIWKKEVYADGSAWKANTPA